jgi:hypothetical protein
LSIRRAWDGDGWQLFALQLVQRRHDPQNIQIVPDRVRGDAGIEFFSIDGCLYQCYAPEETADTAKAASAMKAKGSRDLQKLVTHQNKIAALLQSVKARRWILLCPFLDDKDVVASVRSKGEAIKAQSLSILSEDFEALVQSQDDFAGEIEQLRLRSLGPPLQIEAPSAESVAAASGGEMSASLSEKLSRAFPKSPAAEIEIRKTGYVRAHLLRENILDSLRLDHAVLWERSSRCLDAEERRLVAAGSGSGQPGQQITDSISRIEQSLHTDLPDLPRSTITDIAVGTISDWLIRCPLDFPEGENT